MNRTTMICVAAGILAGGAVSTLSAQVQQATGKAPLAAMKGPIGDKGPTGDKGPPGDKGRPGDRGPAGIKTGPATGYSIQLSQNVSITSGVGRPIFTPCPAGKHAIGGGVWSSSPDIQILESYPSDPSVDGTAAGWNAFVYEGLGKTFNVLVRVYAICLDVIPQ